VITQDTAHDDHVPHHAAEEEEDAVSLLSLPKRRKRDANSFRKAPQAPKRFKSSYICFFMAKQAEIKAALAEEATVTAISKRSAELWYVGYGGNELREDGGTTQQNRPYMLTVNLFLFISTQETFTGRGTSALG
jgi:hypothetical protein